MTNPEIKPFRIQAGTSLPPELRQKIKDGIKAMSPEDVAKKVRKIEEKKAADSAPKTLREMLMAVK